MHDETRRQKELLSEFDIIPTDFNGIAKDYNQRLTSPINSQVREKPGHSDANGKKKRGRPVGSGIKKETRKKAEGEKRKPGHPKGSKNKAPEGDG